VRRWYHAFVAVALAAAACGDPVRDAAVEALGPEDPAVRPGPLHRPGQPCLLCHVAGGAAGERRYSVAGTVYRDPDSMMPLADVEVWLIDSRGRQVLARSNCAGNFYLRSSQFLPVFPLWVTLRHAGLVIDMESPMRADGSCATCHTDPRAPSSAGHVYVTDDPMSLRTPAMPTPCGGTP